MTNAANKFMTRALADKRPFAHAPLVLLAALAAGCTESDSSNQPGGPPPQGITLGSSIAGLTPAEQGAFDRGREVFIRTFKPSEGLGPLYNAVSCRSCHSTPVAGGSSKLYRNFYIARIGNPGEVDLLSLPSPAVPAYGTGEHALAQFDLEGGRTVMPADFFGSPVTVAQRNGIPIFGVGMFEFVSDATLMGLTDPEDMDGDGISGRYNTEAGAIGRFGVKAQANNIESFTRAPLQNQMGITSDPFLGVNGIVSFASHAAAPALLQGTSSPNDPTSDNDGVPDPEISASDLGDLIAFTRFLAPPEPLPFSAEAVLGEALFDSLGCVKCHVPTLTSSRGPVNAYSDLLLHEMGDDLSDELSFGVPQPSTLSAFTTHKEFRTQPLWGLRNNAPFLHDGRAETIDEAVRLHGGEATAIRDAYVALPQTDRDNVLEFLESL